MSCAFSSSSTARNPGDLLMSNWAEGGEGERSERKRGGGGRGGGREGRMGEGRGEIGIK